MDKKILMLSTNVNGGIRTVIETYKNVGMFDKWNIQEVVTHSGGSFLSKILVAARAYCLVLYLLCLKKVSVIHIHASMRGSFYRKSIFVILAHFFRVPTVFHLHGSEFKQFYEVECNSIMKCYVRYIFNLADRVIVLSKEWESYITNKVKIRASVDVIYNFVEDVTFRDLDKNNQSILFMGLLGRRKGIFDLLDALIDLCKQFPAIKLYCGGDGDVEGVKRRISELGLGNNVEMLGWVTGKAKDDLFKRSEIFVLPSYNEGLPMAILESFRAGTPVISTYVGGIPEAIYDGEQGFLINPGDVESLKDCIVKILSDQNLKDNMGKSARNTFLSRFSAQVMKPELENIYRDLGARCTY